MNQLVIGKSNAVFPAVRWLAKAMGKSRELLSVITFMDGKGYATDGKRMHTVEGGGIKEGTYKVLKNTKQEVVLEECLIKPPSYDKIIPESDRLSEPLEITSEWCRDKDVREGNIVLRFARGSPAEVRVNLVHLLEALDIKETRADTFYFQWLKEGNYRNLVIAYDTFHGLRKAVLAGIKRKPVAIFAVKNTLDESQDRKTDGPRLICDRCQSGPKTSRRSEMVSSGQIKEVHFERVFNLGSYESFRIGLTATVGPKQTAEEVVVTLDEFTIKLHNKLVKEKG